MFTKERAAAQPNESKKPDKRIDPASKNEESKQEEQQE
jgi:hypothetical protein